MEPSSTPAPMETPAASTGSSPTAEPSPIVTDNEARFLQRIAIGVCEPLPPDLMLTATQNLCRSLLLQHPASTVMKKAAKLAAQLRDVEHPNRLLVSHVELRRFCDVQPGVDLMTVVCEPFTTSVVSQWRINFAAFIDRLTETQATVFGPWFACVLLRLAWYRMAVVATDVGLVTRALQLAGLLDASVEWPAEAAAALLSKYVGAKPDRVLSNTVLAGFLFAYHKQSLSPLSKHLVHVLIVDWLEFAGMELLMLVFTLECMVPQCGPAYRYFIHKFGESAQQARARRSWKAMRNFSDHLETVEIGAFWKYAKVFDEDPRTDISYNGNKWLCNLTLYLIDRLNRMVHTDWRKWWEPTLLKIQLMSVRKSLSMGDVELANYIADLLYKIGFRMEL